MSSIDIKTSFDAETILFKLLNVDSVKTSITGEIYKNEDIPAGVENLVNIAINTVLMPMADRVQSGTFNVNIYVPFISQTVGGKTIKVPNSAKVNEVTKKVVLILNKVYKDNYNIYIESQTAFKHKEAEITISNIRVKLNNHKY